MCGCGWVGGVTQQIFTRKARGGEGGEGVSGTERADPLQLSIITNLPVVLTGGTIT